MRHALLFLVFLLPVIASAMSPSEHREWLACKIDSDCTAVELGCYYWQPVNKESASKMKEEYPPVCAKSTPAGPQPPALCASRLCANGPYTVRHWKEFAEIRDSSISERMRVCLQKARRPLGGEDRLMWRERYLRAAERLIQTTQIRDGLSVDALLESAVPCRRLQVWQQSQEKWEDSQQASAVRVRVESVSDDYPLDELYPALIRYGQAFRDCGRTASGAEFWGRMHAQFSLGPDGRIEPASFDATYPAARMQAQFIDCASAAFLNLSFPRPRDGKPTAQVRIDIPFVAAP